LRKRTQSPAARRHPESGIALLLSALLLGVLIAFVGLAVDLGYWVATRSQLQTAADLAALAGAQDLSEAAARECAGLNGIDENETKVRLENGRVEVEIRRQAPAFFSRIVGHHQTTLTARAVAIQAGGQVVLTE